MGAMRNICIVLEIIVLLGIVGTSLTSVITIALLKSDFSGYCPLYPTVTKQGSDGFRITPHDVSNCNYVIGFNAVALLLAILIGIGRAVEVIKQPGLSDNSLLSLIIGILCGVTTLLALTSACIVTVGFKSLCNQLVSVSPEEFKSLVKCVHFQKTQGIGYDISHFHDYLSDAQV
ncbi:transmembrane protein 179B-like [Diadema antillarum]|uniref:transmembrane protein 179B-like n=1 Tax=Diadema antillarum TaxID=105358 RepID=UPI003A89BFF8